MTQGYFLRRKKLGLSSCKCIRKLSKNIIRGKIMSQKLYADPDLVCIRWGTTAQVPQKNVFNTAEAIHEVNDKKAFRLKLADAGLAPLSWSTLELFTGDVYEGPIILRPAVHAQGKHCYKCNTVAEAHDVLRKYIRGDYYISAFIDKVAEYRVFVAQGRAVWVAKKTPGNPQDVAWNVARGGRFDNVRFSDWPLKAVKVAIEAFNLSALDFGGVDIMVDKDGGCYVLEINSAPSQTSPYRQECVAKAFDYMLTNGKARIPLMQAKGGYTKFIHPAIDANAKTEQA